MIGIFGEEMELPILKLEGRCYGWFLQLMWKSRNQERNKESFYVIQSQGLHPRFWYFWCFGFVIEVGLYTWGLQTKSQHHCNYIDECIMVFIWPLHRQRSESWWRKFQKLTRCDVSQGTFFKNLWIWDNLWVQFFPF